MELAAGTLQLRQCNKCRMLKELLAMVVKLKICFLTFRCLKCWLDLVGA